MRFAIRLTTMLALALALGVGASVDATTTPPPRPFRALSTANMSSEAQSHIEMGDELISQRKYGKARKEYKKAIEVVRSEGEFPSAALYRVAAAYYFEGQYKGAARQLDKIAEEASDNGDIVTHAWALADAAWVLGQAGARIDVDRRLEKLQKLLRSPYLPDEVREEVTSKRLGDATTLE